ncbi:MAG: hypothetical protein ACW964_17565 [Candidatus Hodarchaeales archaeon]
MFYESNINRKKIRTATDERRDTDINVQPILFVKKDFTDATKICSRCGEEYPEDTIHDECILCGTPL